MIDLNALFASKKEDSYYKRITTIIESDIDREICHKFVFYCAKDVFYYASKNKSKDYKLLKKGLRLIKKVIEHKKLAKAECATTLDAIYALNNSEYIVHAMACAVETVSLQLGYRLTAVETAYHASMAVALATNQGSMQTLGQLRHVFFKDYYLYLVNLTIEHYKLDKELVKKLYIK